MSGEREKKVDRIAAVVAKKMEEEESSAGDSRGHMRVINAVEERATYGLEWKEGRKGRGVSHAAVMIVGAGLWGKERRGGERGGFGA